MPNGLHGSFVSPYCQLTGWPYDSVNWMLRLARLDFCEYYVYLKLTFCLQSCQEAYFLEYWKKVKNNNKKKLECAWSRNLILYEQLINSVGLGTCTDLATVLNYGCLMVCFW